MRVGTLGFAAFLTDDGGPVVRTGLLDRYGRVAVVRGLSVVSVVGLVLFVFGPNVPLAFIGTLLWGAGASLGFPVGMSAAAGHRASDAPKLSRGGWVLTLGTIKSARHGIVAEKRG